MNFESEFQGDKIAVEISRNLQGKLKEHLPQVTNLHAADCHLMCQIWEQQQKGLGDWIVIRILLGARANVVE
jgi:hypothetical protein